MYILKEHLDLNSGRYFITTDILIHSKYKELKQLRDAEYKYVKDLLSYKTMTKKEFEYIGSTLEWYVNYQDLLNTEIYNNTNKNKKSYLDNYSISVEYEIKKVPTFEEAISKIDVKILEDKMEKI